MTQPKRTAIADLKPHPRNYNEHPEDQVAAIGNSLKQHGQYRNIVAAKDGTILAGHGVVMGAQSIGWDEVDVVYLPYDADDPRALKVLASDNTLATFSLPDDRELTELLKEIREFDEYGLDGTGFDDMMLASLVMVTRPASEIADHDHAAEWLGLPEYERMEMPLKYTISFQTEADRKSFAEKCGLRVGDDDKKTWSANWPEKPKDDLKSVIIDG